MSLTLKKHELEYVLAGLASPILARTNVPVSIKARSAAKAIHSLLGARGCSPGETAAKNIASLWRSDVLLKYAHSVPKRELWAFLEKNVETAGAGIFETVSEMQGAIIATPHYGPFLPLCLDLIRRFDGRRRLNIMFNDPAKTPSNRAHEELFRSLACNVGFYYPDRKGTIAALKGLKRGEVLALMPDVYFQSESLMALPFFGRLLRVMPGTSFFSVKSGSPIVPVYPYPADTFGMRVVIDDPVCPATVRAAGGDTGEDSMFFEVTRRYFQSFQNVLCADPVHWNYWDTLLQRSTAFKPYRESSPDGPGILLSELERLARALAPRFNQSPAFESRFAEFHVHYKSRLGE